MDSSDKVIPVLDEDDTAAVVALLIRAVRIRDQIAADRDLIKEANARIAANSAANAKAITALTVFGFELGEGNVWDRVSEALGPEAYNRAVAKGEGKQPPTLLERMGDSSISRGASATVLLGDKVEAEIVRRPIAINDAILQYLRAVGEAGTNVAQIKQHLADAYGITVHEKTPGMTLYRLLKKGLARRVGRTWYATGHQETNENEAPTARTEDASETALAAQ